MTDIKPRVTARIYTIYDRKTDEISHLQKHKHEAAAVRSFCDIVADPQTMLNRHPEDYVLVCLGQVNEDNTITGTARHIEIMTAVAAKEALTPEENQK